LFVVRYAAALALGINYALNKHILFLFFLFILISIILNEYNFFSSTSKT
jgi:preprotein translocase subunit SecG